MNATDVKVCDIESVAAAHPGVRGQRFTRLPELGWQDFRATSGMVTHGWRLLLNRVGAALVARGCPRTW
jgi:hypothetical protein